MAGGRAAAATAARRPPIASRADTLAPCLQVRNGVVVESRLLRLILDSASTRELRAACLQRREQKPVLDFCPKASSPISLARSTPPARAAARAVSSTIRISRRRGMRRATRPAPSVASAVTEPAISAVVR